MPLIDNNGKIFGKVNVIDFLAVIFFLNIFPMLYFGYKLYEGNKAASAEVCAQSARELAALNAGQATKGLNGNASQVEKSQGSAKGEERLSDKISSFEKTLKHFEEHLKLLEGQIQENTERISLIEDLTLPRRKRR